MKYSKIVGIVAPEYKWAPSPSHILRRLVILDIMRTRPRGSVLEVGCGSGAILYDLAMLGFYGVGIDISEEARNLASKILRNVHSFKIVDDFKRVSKSSFDYIMAFEVLEHIENDLEALKFWYHYLKDNGELILSVPAHRYLWSYSDEWAGHYRRYEKHELCSKIVKTGFDIVEINCYGYPLLNVIRPFNVMINKYKLKQNKDVTIYIKTKKSGTDRKVEMFFFRVYSNFLSQILFLFFHKIQKKFYNHEKGTGWLVVARKK